LRPNEDNNPLHLTNESEKENKHMINKNSNYNYIKIKSIEAKFSVLN
jgi:hypothetical protein